jgi:hypothetical protein
MPECWKCENEISHLIRHRTKKRLDAYAICDDDIAINERIYKYTSQSFTCPKCHRILFNKEPRAKKFLIEKTTSKW